MTKIAFVVAIAENGVIGRKGALPWRIGADMTHFKRLTIGKPVIMGRKTWESLPRKPLPDRPNIVVTQKRGLKSEGAEIAGDVGQAVLMARKHAVELGVDEIMVIGGAQIYEALERKADRIYLTEVHMAPKGDAQFHLTKSMWHEVSREHHKAGEKDSADYSFVLLERA
jgi:dihydrofolate reductase